MESKHIIMRRVYYSFAISVLTSAAFWQGIVLGVSVAAFGRLTHVAAIWQNTLAVPLGNIPNYVLQTFINAFLGGEFLTLLITLLMLGLSVKFARQMGIAWLQTVRRTV